VQRITPTVPSKIWLQLASSNDVDELSEKFERMSSQDRNLFQGIKPYVLRTANHALLLVGPFRGASDADYFAQDLETLGVRSSKYINSQTDRIAPLASE
jgi:hypothetical protein